MNHRDAKGAEKTDQAKPLCSSRLCASFPLFRLVAARLRCVHPSLNSFACAGVPFRALSASFGVFCLSAVGLLFVSCGTISRTAVAPPEIPGATYVGNKACYYCH